MAVRIRLKRLGRRHRPFFRICVMDAHTPRDGKAIEEVGTYDPMVRETDKRCTMKADRVDYWIGVGAKPTKKVLRLIEKYKGKVPDLRVDPPRQVSIPEAKPILATPKPLPEDEAQTKAGEEASAETAELAPETTPETPETNAEAPATNEESVEDPQPKTETTETP